MAEKPEENSKLENVGDARPAGTNLCLPKDGEPQVIGKEPTEDSDKAGKFNKVFCHQSRYDLILIGSSTFFRSQCFHDENITTVVYNIYYYASYSN